MHVRLSRSALVGVAALSVVLPAVTSVGAAASGDDRLRAPGTPADTSQYRGDSWDFGPGWRVVTKRLDNPRQLAWGQRKLIVAEAGHGSYKKKNCTGMGNNRTCIGLTGKVASIKKPKTATMVKPDRVAKRLLSAAGADGSFAVGSDGADYSKRPFGIFAVITYGPPELFPEGVPGRQSGKLMKISPISGKKQVYANITKFEKQNDPDGEGFDSNPYAVLALPKRQLVVDAAADAILEVRKGKVSLWAVLPELGKRVDAVPTSITKGPDGLIYVGGLGSELPGNGAVFQFSKRGKLLGTLAGFNGVTGVAVGRKGAIWVSELFGGGGPGQLPGQLVRVAPNLQQRTTHPVPFPAGLIIRDGKLFVSAFSVSTAKGSFGPGTSGQVWRRSLGR